MPKPFPDRRGSLFGRTPDLSHLLDRAGRKGMTAVVARAQMGKTWLLEQLAQELGEEPYRCLVGYFEDHGEGGDALLRAVSDLYTRWLSDASYRQQAKMVWKQQRNDLLAKFSLSLGHVLDKIAASQPIATVVDEALQGMISANQTLRSGGLELKPLQYEQAQKLVALVAQVSARPVALVLDGWEKSSPITVQANTLDAILRHFDDWPGVHIFLGLRPENGADRYVENMQEARPGMAELYGLPRLHLDDLAERQRLLAWLREEIPAARAAGEDELMAMIDGHAGVISRWQDDAATLTTVDDLRRRVDEANRYLYQEFDRLLPDLPNDSPARQLAIRLAIFPTADSRFWNLVKRPLLDKIDEAQLDTLVQQKILESADPPSYGHDKRWEAARQWCYKKWRVSFKREAEAAVFSMAAQVCDVEERSGYFASALAALITDVRAWNLPPLPQALCQCTASLLGQGEAVDTDNLLSVVRNADPDARARNDACTLIAMGLFNTLNRAKAEEDLPRRDALLEALRALAAQYPDEAAVREPLAMGLFNTLNHAKAEEDLPQRDALLEALRALAAQYPDDAAVREWLAKGLFNTLNHAKAGEDLPQRDALLEALREVAAQYPDDAAVREQLAKGLLNALNHAKAEEDLPRRDALLEALRALAAQYPDDAAVR
ncbi:hypothetical protein SAMN05216420_104255, partial [Nitrosospira sp. Nl5]|uniref:ATP-binding protein n=1 Tax=Nitrosospira sp. Nl5 TaxID=200120 RepID=UPI0008840DED